MKLRLVSLCLTAISFSAFANAQLGNTIYNNAIPAGLTDWGLVTAPRVPSGFWSEIQAPNTQFGVVANGLPNRVADDFTISGEGAFLDSIAVFAMIFDNAPPLPTMTGGAVEIRSGSPSGLVLATGTFDFATGTSIYRHATGAPNTDYQVQRIMFDFPKVFLAPGTYWATYHVTHPLTGNVRFPALTKAGAATTPGANARYLTTGAGWQALTDAGGAQDLPFWLQGSDCVGKLFAYDITSRQLFQVGPYSLDTSVAFSNPPGSPTFAAFTYDARREKLYASATDTHSLYGGGFEGNLSLVGSYGLTSPFVHGLEFNSSNGFLYGVTSSSGGNNLYRVNTGTGATTLIGSTGLTSGFRNLAYNSLTNVMYMTDSATDSLYTVNLNTGLATLVGLLNGPINPNGLAFAPDMNTLFLIENNGNLWRVNMATGACILQGDIGAGNFLGLVYRPDDVFFGSPTVLSGTPFGGNSQSLQSSDDDRFYVLNDENEPNCSVLVIGSFCLRQIGSLYITLEHSATRDDMNLFVDLNNAVANSFENIYSTTTSLTDTSVTLSRQGSQYGSETRFVSIRLRTVPQTDIETADGWATAFDLVRFRAVL